jgi:hypothetical protein
MQRALVIQVALSFALAIGAGLFVRSLPAHGGDLGFRTQDFVIRRDPAQRWTV